MTEPPAPDLVERPRWTLGQWAMASGVAIGIIAVLGVLFLALQSVQSLERQLQSSDDQYEQFLAVRRESNRLEVALLRSGSTTDDTVQTRVATLARQTAVLSGLRAEEDLPASTRADVLDVMELHRSLGEVVASGDATAAANLAGELEVATKVAADRAETARRGTLLAQVGAASDITARTLTVLAVVLVINSALLFSLRRRSKRSYEVAYEVALEHARNLEASNEELREANETKRRFVSMISHELRTPLTVIRGFAETLSRHSRELGEEQRDQLATLIVRQALRQQRMVEDLLILSRREEDVPKPSPMTMRVNSLVARVIDQLASTETPIDHVDLLGGPDCTLWADPHHTEQVLQSLLSNAAKYGGPSIEVSWAATTEHIMIVVEDDGPGVPDDFVHDLFSPFTQGDEGDRRLSRGVGLGLTIAQLLATANAGSVRYAHRDGGGARFEVTMPRATAADIPPDAFRAARRAEPKPPVNTPPEDILPKLT